MEWLISLDEQILLWINGAHSDFGDTLMSLVSSRAFWIPLYLLLAILLYRQRVGWEFLVSVLLVVIVVVLSDQISSSLLKPLLSRPRPCHEPRLAGLVQLVDGHCGGAYGFVSSHAANFFALAAYCGWHIWGRWRWMVVGLFLIAGLVSYSRIYLGVHYPGDILGGMSVGLLSGGLGILLFKKISTRINFPQTSGKSSPGAT